MTFKDYALRDYDETSGILESDWYNAQVELLRLSSETWGSGLIQIEEGDFFTDAMVCVHPHTGAGADIEKRSDSAVVSRH